MIKNSPWNFQFHLQVRIALSFCAASVIALSLPAFRAHAQTSSYSSQLDEWQSKVSRFERGLKDDCDELDEEQRVIDLLKIRKDELDKLYEESEINNADIDKKLDNLYAAGDRMRDDLGTAREQGSISEADYDTQMRGVTRVQNKMAARLLDGKMLTSLYEENFYATARRYNRLKSRLNTKREFKGYIKTKLQKLRDNPPPNPTLIVGKPNPNPDAPKFPDKRIDEFAADVAHMHSTWEIGAPDYINLNELDANSQRVLDLGQEISDYTALRDLCMNDFSVWHGDNPTPASCQAFISENDSEKDSTRNDEDAIDAEANALIDALQRALDEAEAILRAGDDTNTSKTPDTVPTDDTKPKTDPSTAVGDDASVPTKTTSTPTRADAPTTPIPDLP